MLINQNSCENLDKDQKVHKGINFSKFIRTTRHHTTTDIKP